MIVPERLALTMMEALRVLTQGSVPCPASCHKLDLPRMMVILEEVKPLLGVPEGQGGHGASSTPSDSLSAFPAAAKGAGTDEGLLKPSARSLPPPSLLLSTMALERMK